MEVELRLDKRGPEASGSNYIRFTWIAATRMDVSILTKNNDSADGREQQLGTFPLAQMTKQFLEEKIQAFAEALFRSRTGV
jgi:hypothetical protein